MHVPNIILGIANPLDPDNTNSQDILILKYYYYYKCRCLSDKLSIHYGLKYLKYCIRIEKITMNYLSFAQKEYIYTRF